MIIIIIIILLIFQVYTVEPESGSSVIVGYALLNIFVEMGSRKQPIADAGMQVDARY